MKTLTLENARLDELNAKRILVDNRPNIILDTDWHEMLSSVRWFVNAHGYAFARAPRINKIPKYDLMHRIILDAKKGEFIDHINGNKTDNRRSNLRFCTHRENCINRPKDKKNATSKYKGVIRRKPTFSWVAQIKIDKKNFRIGLYKTEDEAAFAYNKKAAEVFGEFAHLNIIEDALAATDPDREIEV